MLHLASIEFAQVVDYLGALAFALSGIRLALKKGFDLFGAYVIGFVTAVGGGTLRDLLLDVEPFWMSHPSYIIITGVAIVLVWILGRRIVYLYDKLYVFDAFGLGLFVLIGIEKTLVLHYPFWLAILMGTITGCVGSIVRDVLIGDIPIVFRREVYALTCVAGGLVYWLCTQLNLQGDLKMVISASSIICLRLLAVRYKWHLPQFIKEQ